MEGRAANQRCSRCTIRTTGLSQSNEWVNIALRSGAPELASYIYFGELRSEFQITF